jgi:hypothetical protein
MLHRERELRSAMSIRDVLRNAALFALQASPTRAPLACKSNYALCQNCVRYPIKPGSNTVICRNTPIHIGVAGSRCSGVRWCDLVCVSTREGVQFPSVLLQPLGHLSVSFESAVYRLVDEPANLNCGANCVRPPNAPRSLTPIWSRLHTATLQPPV